MNSTDTNGERRDDQFDLRDSKMSDHFILNLDEYHETVETH
uniref:Uncharacterized protein n=1 Tax=Peronospora matthiolae TaxID=2874970 RepID=A0AAV1UIU5_9STRA